MARGWSWSERPHCPEEAKASFYSLETETKNIEAYLPANSSRALISKLPLPEFPYICQKITEPQFVEEI